jgi:hypothetical protein
LFKEWTDKRFVDYSHRENNYNDFKIQPLLPHQYSRSGPSMTKGDVNGDGLEDFYISASSGTSGMLFLQNTAGFEQKAFPNLASADETSCLLFDADGDKDLDLYLVHGGSEFAENAPEYQDELYENDGKGHFKPLKTALPDTRASGSTVVSCDFDHDGDLDLFIGGRVVAGRYPIAPRSYLLRNDSKPQQLQFTDITPSNLQNMGMVTSAIWARTDADAWEDLVLVGEYMPLTIFRNQKGQFTKSEKAQTTGWWSSVTAADFDKDGDMDLMVGNLGLNTRYRASVTAPLTVYAKDFDKNGRIDPILCGYNQGKNYMVCTRDELIKQIPAMRSRFGRYEDFAKETVENSFTAAELKDALFLKAECLTSMYFENDGNGRFEPHILPIAAQFAPINSILAGDFDQDGHLDALIAGNAYETEPTMGRYDASLGLLLKGDGKGHFKSILAQQTGFRADKDAKSMLKIQLKDPKNQLVVVGNNADKIQTFLYIDKK